MKASSRRHKIFMMDLWATVPYYTAYLSRALLAQGANLSVGSITYYLDTECFSSRGIRLDPGLLDVVGRFRLPKLPRRLLKLAEAMLNLCALSVRFLISPPDIVHVQYLPMLKWKVPLDLWFLRFCRSRGARLVLTVHDLLPHDTGEEHKQTFLHLYAMVNGIICHSDHIRMRLIEEFCVSEEKIKVIPHGPFFYDLENVNNPGILNDLDVSGDQMLVLWQGIIFPYKGVDLLLEAWKEVERAVPGALLIIAGTGAPALLDAIRQQVEKLALKQVKLHFEFISAEDLAALYRTSDIVVYPYRAITTSGALATGLALGKPIVASNLPVFRELLTSGENALLVNPQDNAELSGALIELLLNSTFREWLAMNTRNMNFGEESWRSIAKQTIDAYTFFASRTDVLYKKTNKTSLPAG